MASIDDLIAPYQSTVDKIRSPYATMSANSWLARKHPLVAQMLDNAFLTAAETPSPRGPEGAGGGISRTFQGLMGAQQFRHQQMLEDLMLPYQMAMPRLQAEHTLAQIGQEQSYADYLKKHGEYLDQMADINQQKTDIANERADIARYHSQAATPEERAVYNKYLKQYNVSSVDKLPLDALTSAGTEINTIRREQRIRTGSLTPADAASLAYEASLSNDPELQKKAEAARKAVETIYGGIAGIQAGAKTTGSETAPHPYSEQKSFLQNERQKVYSKLSPILSFKDWNAQYGDPLMGGLPSDTPQGPMTGPTPNQLNYQKYLDQAKIEHQKADFNWSQYERWAQSHPGKGYEESPWGSHPPTDETEPTSNTPSNSGSNWTPR